MVLGLQSPIRFFGPNYASTGGSHGKASFSIGDESGHSAEKFHIYSRSLSVVYIVYSNSGGIEAVIDILNF